MSLHDHDQSHNPSHRNHEVSHSHSDLTEESKLIKMVEHWIQHNEDHGRSYLDWAKRARLIGKVEVGEALERVARDAHVQNEHLLEALRLLTKGSAER